MLGAAVADASQRCPFPDWVYRLGNKEQTRIVIMIRLLASGFWLVVGSSMVFGQGGPAHGPTASHDVTRQALAERLQRLARLIDVMARQGVRDPILADVEIYRKAVEWALRHEELKTATNWDQAGAVVDRGLLRAMQLLRGETPWMEALPRSSPRGFRSRIDGSLQPYAVVYPPGYAQDPRGKWRLDVVLHGRDASLNEVKFLFEHSGDRPAEAPSDHVVLHVFGRGNLGYRWAAETDVWEAIDHFVAVERSLGRDMIDPRRVVLRGFSMGGAGAWHLGLHRPDRWAVIAPGAGFVTTRGYVKNLPENLPEYIEKSLTIYDAIDYSANAWNVPIVAFAGQNDTQAEAVRRMQERLTAPELRFKVILAPGLGHQFPKEWQERVQAEIAKFLASDQSRPEYPDRVVFHTYTLKYPGCYWVEILGMENHYQRAEVDATRQEGAFKIATKNIRLLRLLLPPGEEEPQTILIDSQSLLTEPIASASGTRAIFLEKLRDRWEATLPQRITTLRLRKPQKFTGLTGPIDDAFTDSFLCVRGTKVPWHREVGETIDRRLDEFRQIWSRYFRGELPVKNDTEVTEEDMATRHLILFGDPGSNRLLEKILHDLPIVWTKDSLRLANRSFDAKSHFPVLIYPSPLHPNRYVVLNTGHTFEESDLIGSNALLFPRLGDCAVLQADGKHGKAVWAQIFDDFWSFPGK